MVATQLDRIAEIERDRKQILGQYDDQLRTIAAELEIPAVGLIQQGLYLQHRLAGLEYRRERNDITFGRRQLLRPPFGVMRRGGDCDDLNLVILGGLLQHVRHSPLGIHSLYLPDAASARHVALLVKEYDIGYVLDLVPPRQHGPWIGAGFPVSWAE